MLYDAIIIGTGPAGLSAALNLQVHQKSFLWLGSPTLSDKVAKAVGEGNVAAHSIIDYLAQSAES